MAEPGLDGFAADLDYPMFVVTAVDPGTGERSGCLVGFATQCGLDPDRFSVWVSHANHTHRVALASPVLAVHSPGDDQRDLAALFGTCTGDEVDKFARCSWRAGPHGVPVLPDTRTWFVGRVLERARWTDHTAFVLAPVEVGGTGRGRPLMFSAVRDLQPGHPA